MLKCATRYGIHVLGDLKQPWLVQVRSMPGQSLSWWASHLLGHPSQPHPKSKKSTAPYLVSQLVFSLKLKWRHELRLLAETQ